MDTGHDVQASIEQQLLSQHDVDHAKLAQLAKTLFVMNGWKPGPIPASYMIICTKPGQEWCVGQLWAHQEQPFRIIDDARYPTREQAEAAAKALKESERSAST